ncbi:MAG: HprK-related kinase A [Gammaproteobacteria bacterium]|nr:HprK-related kinase A [Gammaproteobacteria bacterium]MCP5196346.1 HprK-related kinase A [Gammaproteobacteria bacterium]
MNFASLEQAELCTYLARGLRFRSGPFIFNLQTDLSEIAPLLRQLYAAYPLALDAGFTDFCVNLQVRGGVRRWWRPQVQLWLDGKTPFQPFPRDTALPFLEWGLNWCVAMHAHHYLMLHAGVIARDDRAILLPAWPGSGKSTLCTALTYRGWRFLSDEFALIRPSDLHIAPFPRLIALKNESISVIRQFAPAAVMGPAFPKTRKGTVCHVRPPVNSIENSLKTAKACWVVFPDYQPAAAPLLRPLDKARAFLKLAGNSFNYELIGLRGFETVAGLIDSCDCYLFQYSDLEQAVAQLNALADGLI